MNPGAVRIRKPERIQETGMAKRKRKQYKDGPGWAWCQNCGGFFPAHETIYGTPLEDIFGSTEFYCIPCGKVLGVREFIAIPPKVKRSSK